MTTLLNDRVVVEPNGLVRACAWCLTPERLAELSVTHTVTHSLCTACSLRMESEAA